MKIKPIVEKMNLYPRTLALGAAGILLAAPIFADTAAQDQQRQQTEQTEEQGSPTINVDESAPRVQVEQPAPQVSAQQGQTEVEVETGEPEVSVNQPEPEVSIDQPEPEVSIQQPEPEVSVDDAEPQVDVHQGEPEVTVNSAEPEVRIIEKDASGERKDGEQSASAQASSQASPEASQGLMQAQLDELQGREVVTSAGEELGSVEDIVASRQGSEAGLVVSVGGFLGLGATDVFVPANEAQMQGDRIVWQTSQSPDEVKQTRQYQADQYQSVTDRYNTLQEVQQSAVSTRSPS